ncbi:hypothetical protein ACFQZ2_06275, partial [Streptomonospora algeriensis]
GGENGADSALEGLAAAAERIVASGRIDLGDVAPAERARLLEALERKGIIGPAGPGGDRQVLASTDEAIADILDDGDPVTEYARTEDPSPEIVAGPDDEIPDLTADEAALETPPEEGKPLSPPQARQVMYAWLRQRAADGRPHFTGGDPGLVEVRQKAGTKRPWVYKVLKELEEAGVLSRTESGYTIDGPELLDEIEARL